MKRMLLPLMSLICAAPVAWAADPVTAPPLGSPYLAGTWAAVTGLVILIMLGGCRKYLSNNWNLGDALSEPQDITDTNNQTVKKLVPSSSRLIALLGTIVILALYVSFGLQIVMHIIQYHTWPGWADQAGGYLVYGLTLFAPYAVNKVSGIGK